MSPSDLYDRADTRCPLTDITVRRASGADAEQLARLVSELGYPTSPDHMRKRLQSILRDDDYDTLVACQEATILGFIGLRAGPLYESDDRYGQIMALAVAADHQRRGVGRVLLQAAESILVQRGVGTLVVTSGNHRAGAHQFYERSGYTFTGRRYVKSRGQTAAPQRAARRKA
jgi:ribosomal protein S18 acetylase RimI-like enzyme